MSVAMSAIHRASELAFYREHLEQHILPFWNKALDREYGGVFTCYTNAGDQLISTDKFTWSQGRFLWLWSRIARMSERGLLQEDVQKYTDHARATFHFMDEHVFLPNGNCSFLLTREGEHKESIPGLGYDVSFYADCFVVLGYTEFARLTKDQDVLEKAVSLYRHIDDRLRTGRVRSEPYPIPDGYEAHGFSMIMLNVSQELADALLEADDHRAREIREKSVQYMERIMGTFCNERRIVLEVIPAADGASAAGRPDTLLARHVNPGHTLECMWFVMSEARKLQRGDLIRQAMAVAKKAFEIGWDPQYGGLLRYVDREGGAPRGEAMTGDRRFEQLVADTWDMKLWWPHSEAVYTMLLCSALSDDDAYEDMYRQLKDYTFRVFPNPDPAVGEWVQIRDRQGEPANTVVALPVKDPYHITRNLLLSIELLGEPASSVFSPKR